jgi:hypothetical protein
MSDRRGLTLGVVLALVGAFFLLKRSVSFSGPGPACLLLGAILLTVSALRSFRGPILPGGVLAGLGVGFLMQGPLESWLPRWATLLAGLAVGFLLVAGLERAGGGGRHRHFLIPALILLGIAAGAAVSRAVDSTWLIESFAGLWPWLLIAAGLWLVVSAFRRKA